MARAGHLHLLGAGDIEVIVPQVVALEVLAGPAADPAHIAIAGEWGARARPTEIPASVTEWGYCVALPLT